MLSGSFVFGLVDGGGFEPPKAMLTDLQSVPFGHSGTRPYYSFSILAYTVGYVKRIACLWTN